jgi:hypothetical protein
MPRICRVLEADVTAYRSDPPSAEIGAKGLIGSRGWTNPQLVIRERRSEPADGIYDFDFVADAPTGLAVEETTEISACLVWQHPLGTTGIRIHADEGPPLERFLHTQTRGQ